MPRLAWVLCLLTFSTAISPAAAGEKAPLDVKSLAARLADPKAAARVDALRELALHGPAAAPALPPVRDLLEDPDLEVRLVAADCLGRMGKEAVPALIKLLDRKEKEPRYLAALALSIVGPRGEAAVPALIRALADAEWDVRHKAAYALGRMAPASTKAVPALGRLLADEVHEVQHEACEALLRLEGAALAAVPAALKNDNARCRAYAFRILAERDAAADKGVLPILLDALALPHTDVKQTALVRLQKREGVPVPPVARFLEDADPQTRSVAAAVLFLHEDPSPARAALEKALNDPHEPVQDTVFHTLRKVKADPTPLLLKNLEADDAATRFHAARYLFKNDPTSMPAVNAHLRLLKEDKGPYRRGSAYILGRTKGPLGKPAIPVLAEDLSSKDAAVIRDALFVLYYIIPFDPEAALPAFKPLLKHPDAQVREATAFALSRFEKRAWPLVLEMAKDENAEVRRMLYSAVAENVRDTDQLLPFLMDRAINDPGENARLGAIHSLNWFSAKTVAGFLHDLYKKEKNEQAREVIMRISANFGATAAPAIDLFIDGLKDSRPYTRQLAAGGLRSVAGEAKRALPALQAALKDADPDVREAAARALEAIGK